MKAKKKSVATKTAPAARGDKIEKARKAASAEIQERLDRLDAPAPDAAAAPVAPDASTPADPAQPDVGQTVAKAAAPKAKKPKRVSAIDAAAQVLAASDKPMRAVEMIAQMEQQGLWKSPGGKTPEASLYAAIIREISAKGAAARFKKHDRGLFVAGTTATC